jgi:hypothetical protein
MTKKVTTTTTTTTTVVETVDTPTKARLIFVLDRSGSMGSIQTEAIGGFNAFVEGQKAVPGEATLSLVIFDNVVETVHDKVTLEEIPVLTNEVFVPRGMTALYDAIGVTINKYISEGNPSDTKTILAILTDGAENASQEYSGKQVADLVKKAETELGWEVLFLGANIDVQHVAGNLGIQAGKFAAFAASSKGISDTYAAVNTATAMYRSFAPGAAESVNLQALYDQNASQ